jgi:hypothetical protein
VHDQDAKLKKTMERLGVQMQLMIDENHLMKSASGFDEYRDAVDSFTALFDRASTNVHGHALGGLFESVVEKIRVPAVFPPATDDWAVHDHPRSSRPRRQGCGRGAVLREPARGGPEGPLRPRRRAVAVEPARSAIL